MDMDLDTDAEQRLSVTFEVAIARPEASWPILGWGGMDKVRRGHMFFQISVVGCPFSRISILCRG